MTLRIPPVIQFALCALIGWGLSVIFPAFQFNQSWRLAPAVVLICIGAIFLLIAVGAFARARTTVNPLQPDRAETLVTTGLYRISRNPMYLAMALILFGGAVLLGNLVSFIAPVIFIWVMTIIQIKPEERALEALFGESFRAYCQRTRRWI